MQLKFSTGSKIWDEIENAGLSKDEIWELNERILNDAISEGKEFKFSHNPNKFEDSESYFGMEIRYLQENAHKLKKIEGVWHAIK